MTDIGLDPRESTLSQMEKVVALFAGEFDIARKDELRAELEKLVLVPNIVLDFTEVTYIDSTCIGEVIRLHNLRAENHFERETVIVNNENLIRIFQLLELNKLFHITSRLETNG